MGPASCCWLSPCVTCLSFSAISRSLPGVLARLRYGVVLLGVITPCAAQCRDLCSEGHNLTPLSNRVLLMVSVAWWHAALRQKLCLPPCADDPLEVTLVGLITEGLAVRSGSIHDSGADNFHASYQGGAEGRCASEVSACCLSTSVPRDTHNKVTTLATWEIHREDRSTKGKVRG